MIIAYLTDMGSKAAISSPPIHQDKELCVLSLFIGNVKRGIQSDMWNDSYLCRKRKRLFENCRKKTLQKPFKSLL